MIRVILASLLVLPPSLILAGDFSWAPKAPGKTILTANFGLANSAVRVERGGGHGETVFTNAWTGERLLPDETMRLIRRDGTVLAFDYNSFGGISRSVLAPIRSTKSADGRRGDVVTSQYRYTTAPEIGIVRRTILRDGTHYVRNEVTITAKGADLDLRGVELLSLSDAKVEGRAPGSPAVSGDFFAGIEHPMAMAEQKGSEVHFSVKRVLPIRKGTSVTYSYVIGVAPKGQMRRAFLAYVEGERAHPYRPYLHYNSWYDVGYGRPFSQPECLDAINKVGTELAKKRRVKLDSFLFDDGWDNTSSIWEFHSGFPNAFLPLRDAAARYGAGPGVWLSPWGGYGGARNQRLAFGKTQGMEIDSQGYALSGPRYYKRFHDVTMDFVTRQGINQFKFDGTGSPDKSTPGSQFDSDFDAAIALIADLRKARPDLFVNLTTGTWPSPFWLRYADSTWRGGADYSFAGVGSERQRYMTYRDGDTYHGVVQRGPLYPLNSLMVHGVIYARHGITTDPNDEFASDVRDFFGNGTQLQELYLTPDKLSQKNWDDLAEAAKWSRANADTLVDTHWVGGDPVKLEVYGWASWSPRHSILVLRNPSDKPQAFSVDIASVLELPPGIPRTYVGHSPWKADAGQAPIVFPVGQPLVVDLKPFEVRTLDLESRK